MNIRYIVKQEDGVIVAIADNCYFDVINDLAKKNAPIEPMIELDECGDLLINNTYKGVARLAEGDEWDEEFGKKIAKEKALRKYLVAKEKAVQKFVDNSRIFEVVCDLHQYYADKIDEI